MDVDLVVEVIGLYIILIIALAYALSILTIPSNADEFLLQLAVAASRPGTVVDAPLVVGEGTRLVLKNHKAVIEGGAIKHGIMEVYRSLGVGEPGEGYILLNFSVDGHTVYNPGYYMVEISSEPGKVHLRVIEYEEFTGEVRPYTP